MSSSISATSIINTTIRVAISIHQKKLSQLCRYSQGLRCRQGLNKRFSTSTSTAGFDSISRQIYNMGTEICPRKPQGSPILKLVDNIKTTSHRNSAASPQNFSWGETGGDLLVEALEREGVTTVFGTSPCFFLTAALERSKAIRTSIQTFSDDEEAFAAALSYTRLTSAGLPPAVCCITELCGSIYEKAILSNTPVVTIFVSDRLLDPSTAKCIFGVKEVQDIPRVVKQAFSLATSGPRPGPVLINIPSELTMPTQDDQRDLYESLKTYVEIILYSKRPILYMEDGCLSRSNKEVKRFVELTGGIPLASYNSNRSNGSHLYLDYPRELFSFQMLGVDCVDNAVRESDLLLAFGGRSDDAIIDKLIKADKNDVIHIFEDEHKKSHVFVGAYRRLQGHADVKLVLQVINDILEIEICAFQNCVDLSAWREELFKRVSFIEEDKAILPHHVAQMLHELTDGEAIISISSVRDKETWATKFYEYLHVKPTEIEDKDDLSAAIGALVARPNAIVVDIRAGGWEAVSETKYDFELIKQRNLPIKNIFLNYKYGNPPDWTHWEEYNIHLPGARVTKKAELRAAMKKMLDTPGPYLLQVTVLPKAEVSI